MKWCEMGLNGVKNSCYPPGVSLGNLADQQIKLGVGLRSSDKAMELDGSELPEAKRLHSFPRNATCMQHLYDRNLSVCYTVQYGSNRFNMFE